MSGPSAHNCFVALPCDAPVELWNFEFHPSRILKPLEIWLDMIVLSGLISRLLESFMVFLLHDRFWRLLFYLRGKILLNVFYYLIHDSFLRTGSDWQLESSFNMYLSLCTNYICKYLISFPFTPQQRADKWAVASLYL